jgi:tRNA1(Val) A37 N6-methylase TrmN6
MSLDQPDDFVKHLAPTRDAFLDGRLTVSQPGNGFRAGLDSVLLGVAMRQGSATLLDLGSGVGTASLVALAHDPSLSATLVEADPDMLALARINVADNSFAPRATILDLDVTAPGAVRAAAGLKRDFYDTVIANPPYFDRAGGTLAGNEARALARHMGAEALDLWVKTAAASAAPSGEVIFIHTAEALPGLLAAFDQRFGALTLLPLGPRPGEAASRVLVRAIKGSRAPLTLLSHRALHGTDGRNFAPEFDAIFRGRARLVW